MKYGILSYKDRFHGRFNVGDHIQSLAAKQYLPQVDRYIYRDRLNSNISEKTVVILNGWFTHHPENWPPNENLLPLFVSFHLNSSKAEEILSKKENVIYLKKHAPIGCRDVNTVEFLRERKIEAYYSSCLTTTLTKYKTTIKTNDIYLVDVLYKNDYKSLYRQDPKRIIPHIVKGKFFKRNRRDQMIKSLIPQNIINKAINLTHSYKVGDYDEDARFELAEDILRKYASAKLVITSRIHCALPCLALGTPVIFIGGGDLNTIHEMSRLKGIIEHMNILTIDKVNLDSSIFKKLHILNKNEIDWENVQNPSSYEPYSEELKTRCQSFIAKFKEKYEHS